MKFIFLIFIDVWTQWVACKVNVTDSKEALAKEPKGLALLRGCAYVFEVSQIWRFK